MQTYHHTRWTTLIKCIVHYVCRHELICIDDLANEDSFLEIECVCPQNKYRQTYRETIKLNL